jgi:hypothetical protein
MTQDPEERPIPELADLETDVSPSFVNRVRSKIQRRTTVAQYAYFSWTLPGIVLKEFLSVLIHLFAVADGRKGRSQ